MKLNLGCGRDIRAGYVNLDSRKLKGVDVVHDLEKVPYPFKDGSFDEIVASHVLEHMADLAKVMQELCRISKKGGRIHAIVPYFSNPGSFGDPTHKRFFTYETFDYFTENSALSYYSKVRVKIVNKRIHLFGRSSAGKLLGFLPNIIINLVPRFYQRFFAYVLPASELEVVLEVV
ncbi:class I SAM-dependent methyltransferase [Candidatus Woesearchaeota archaeon]|nr:class I SAM-dependent methyltransferase [Candidatus Woesearchaeota archaeon]